MKTVTITSLYNNITAQDLPGRIHFRLNLYDVSEFADVDEGYEYWYSFHYILDNEPGWNAIRIPLVGNGDWDGNGFNRTGWSGQAGNDQLDLTDIGGFTYEFSINGGGEGDAAMGTIIFDNMHLSGAAEDPWLIFNGKTVDPTMGGAWGWGQSSIEVVDGGGEDPATNALLWTQGDEWGNGWSGGGWNVDPPRDLGFRWELDSLKFKAKVDEGTGPVRMQFESGGDGKIGHAWTPIDDGAWHNYSLALTDFVDVDGTTNFNPEAITVFQMMGEDDGTGNGSAIAGQKVYYDFIWTGNPEIDVVPPVAPGLVTASPGSYVNLITWADVPGEDGETYTVYSSDNEITDVDAPGVELVAKGILEGLQIATHVLKTPDVDQDVTLFYAVVCTDAGGNDSEPGKPGSSVTNTAKGTTTIYFGTPPSFEANGDMDEWAEINPIKMYPEDGTGFVVTNTTIDHNADLSVDAYVAMDDTYMYMAFDVTDDINSFDTTISTWLTDGCDIFIGLYDFNGDSHTSYKRSPEPDYHWRFVPHGLKADNPGGDDYGKHGDGNYFFKEKFPSGYIYEARISWVDIAATADDDVFVPEEGMRLIIDYSINDADATGEREGILALSPNNEDQSWADPSRWTYTWIGDKVVSTDDDLNKPFTFNLEQNFPNPFNPTTLIQYSIPEMSDVSVKVFNVLGQEVALLVNEVQNAGVYKVNFDASNLSTGVYMYQIQAGEFAAVKKMLLIK
jgi:hypothetical protein